MNATGSADVPLSVLADARPLDGMMRVTFTYYPGRDACGPAYDHGGLPAEPPEIEIVSAVYLDPSYRANEVCMIADHEEEKVINWLLENWEPPTGPEPDDERDRRRDDALTMGDE